MKDIKLDIPRWNKDWVAAFEKPGTLFNDLYTVVGDKSKLQDALSRMVKFNGAPKMPGQPCVSVSRRESFPDPTKKRTCNIAAMHERDTKTTGDLKYNQACS